VFETLEEKVGNKKLEYVLASRLDGDTERNLEIEVVSHEKEIKYNLLDN
jgi:hypothetical protein